jgi:hypothetical protein
MSTTEKITTPPEFDRKAREHLRRLMVERYGTDDLQLSPQEAEVLIKQAHAAAEAEIGTPGVPVPTTKRADVDPLATIRAEFKADDAPIDDSSGLAHAKAMVVLAASRKPLNEKTYLAALHAVATSAGGRGVDNLEGRLAGAAALSDLAEARLAEHGISCGSDDFEERYISEISRISDTFGLRYFDERI